MLTFCIFLAILYLVIVFAITLPFWYEAGNAPFSSASSSDIPTPPWTFCAVVRLLLEAAYAGILLGIAFIFDPILRRVKPADAATKTAEGDEELPPVLLIHGLYHNPSGWMYFRRHLRKGGFRTIHTLGYSSWKTDIAAITAKLDTEVANLECRYPGKKPLLVGHSLGGLLIRNWLASEANQARVLGAVTLGAPHQGSKVAALAFGNLGKSLQPSNAFFEDLARTENAATIPCTSLVSEADTMVLPQASLVPVTKGWEMRLTPYASHAGILVKGAPLRMAVWELHRIINAVKQEASAEGTKQE